MGKYNGRRPIFVEPVKGCGRRGQYVYSKCLAGEIYQKPFGDKSVLHKLRLYVSAIIPPRAASSQDITFLGNANCEVVIGDIFRGDRRQYDRQPVEDDQVLKFIPSLGERKILGPVTGYHAIDAGRRIG